jgi:orotidine-5'-phosphate decarboxylase
MSNQLNQPPKPINETGRDTVIVALDFPGVEQAFSFLDSLGEERPFLKVGMELFYAAGADLIHNLKERRHRVFLDLKLHDIPNTVQRSMAVLAGLGVDMCNVHAAGTAKMMAAAREGLEQGTLSGASRPLLIAVTQLTSTDQWRMNHEILIPGTVEDAVLAYALLAKSSGMDGVVCSPEEVGGIHRICGPEFLTVTPGIRTSQGGNHGGEAAGTQAATGNQDQVRVRTPKEAKAIGADYIVVGRPITGAKDPLAAYLEIKRDFEGGRR